MINSSLTPLDLSQNNLSINGKIALRDALIWNQTYLNLNDISIDNEKENWIVCKNQSLFDLLFHYLETISIESCKNIKNIF